MTDISWLVVIGLLASAISMVVSGSPRRFMRRDGFEAQR